LLANAGHDTRRIQDWLVHPKSILRNKLAKIALGAMLATAIDGVAHPKTMQSGLTPEQTYALARDAYLYAYPIVSMDITMPRPQMCRTLRRLNMGAPVNQFACARAYPGANEKDVVRFNFDTLYCLAWLDLSREPIMLSVPDTHGRYYLLCSACGPTCSPSSAVARPGRRLEPI
jgi:hypothetical protein